MSSGPEAEARMYSSEEPEIAYRPIATMAVVSFIFALFSGLAFASPYFWVIPPIALIISAMTSTRLEQAKQEYAGQVLTKASVAISLCCLVAAPTQHLLTRFIITREARHQLGDRFLDLILANRTKEAFVLTLAPPNRAGREGNPDELIVRSDRSYREFVNEDLHRLLVNRLAETQVTFLGVDGYGFTEGYYLVGLRYELAVADKTYDVLILAKGGEATQGEWEGRQWYVYQSRIGLKS